MIKSIKFLTLFLLLILGVATSSIANDLTKININNDNLLLLATFLDDKPLISALDTYEINGKLMLAIDPLFDSLALRYTREKNLLRIWKDQTIIDFKLSNNGSSKYWADDGFYLYVDISTFSQLFDVIVSYDKASLKLNIKTNSFTFPNQRLEKLTLQRLIAQSSTSLNKVAIDETKLLKDQYRLFTLPHGSFSLNSRIDKTSQNNSKEKSFNYSIQTASDFLFHSANLTVSDYQGSDTTGRFNLSRYKSLPNELIVGAFDSYSFGDINSIPDNLTGSTQSGLGFIFTRAPEHYRTRNIGTTITEVARPGWDAELYRNGQFIELKKVPLDGNLIFEDVETQYGDNRYEIKLYGPFGEKETRNQYLVLDKNALSKGQVAYNFYGLDNSSRLINNQNQNNFTFNNAGASVSYGITDNWQVGFDYTTRENPSKKTEHLLTLKNALAFPGLLFNNEISMQQDQGYAQITSVSGNAFGKDTFHFIIESSDDYQSDRVHSADIKRQYADFSYNGNLTSWHYSLGSSYLNRDGAKNWQARNTVSKSLRGINFSNNLFYNQHQVDDETMSNINGAFVAAGSLTNNVRMSAAIDYRPDQSKIIQSTSITLAWRDKLSLNHNLRGVYNLQQAINKWRINYNLSWNSDKFQLQLASNYDAESNWSIGLGIRFFLGYDHHNQKIIFSNQLSSHSATLNSYSYLDRNPNGWRDEGDWDLAGVKFTGVPAWKNLESGTTGRAILPGVYANIPFKFNAKWEYGTKAIANNFLLYTHPGAYVDINIPFYITTDFSGFIYKVNDHKEESPLTGVLIELINNNKVIDMTSSDVDGYYQFSNKIPGNYQIRITPEYLTQSGYTSAVTGYEFGTPNLGGIVDLPPITLNKLPTSQKKLAESIVNIDVNTLNNEPNVWLDADNPNFGKVYTLATTRGYSTQDKTFEPDSLPNTPITRANLPAKPISRQQLPVQTVISPTLVSSPMARSVLPVQPITRNKLPIQPVVRSNLPRTLNTEEQYRDIKKAELLTLSKTPTTDITTATKNTFTLQLGAFSTETAAKSLLNQRQNLTYRPYIIQSRRNNKPLYRVFLGEFETYEQANTFKAKTLPLSVKSFIRALPIYKAQTREKNSEDSLSQGFVIQFIAGENKVKILSSAASLTNVNELFLAEKELNGKTWYCLISQTFINKNSAQKELNRLRLSSTSAWLVSIADFNNMMALNKK